MTPTVCGFVCGELTVSDAILNLGFFVPVGAAFALAFGTTRALLAAFALSLFVECAQLWLPGRHASLLDLTSNSTGAALGILLLQVGPRVARPSRRLAFGLAAAWTALVASVLFAGTALLRPALPDTTWWGQWTPDLEGSEQYRGRVLSAHVGELELPSHRLGYSDSVRALLARGHAIEVLAIAGPRPFSPAPIFSMADEFPREILTIAASDTDLVFRVRRASANYMLDRPDLRLHDALAGVQPGDTLRIRVTPLHDDGFRLEVNGARRDARVGTADSWSLFLWPESFARSATTLATMRVLWICALAAPALGWLFAAWRADPARTQRRA